MANLSNINNYFIVDTAGQVAIGDVSAATLPTLQTQLTVYDHTGTAGVIIQSGGGKKYELFSNASGTFGISDIGVGDRLTISSGGDATFAGDITLNDDLNFSTNGFADISNTGTGAMRFKPTSQTLALTLTGANATFAGNVELKSDAGNATKYLRIWNEGTAANDDAVLSWTAQASRTYSMGIHRDSGNLVITNADASVASGDILNISNSGTATFSGANTYNKIQSFYSGDYTSGWKFSDYNGGIWYDAGTDDLYVNGNHANSQIILQSGGATALTLDSSQNATFAESIGLGGATIANSYRIEIAASGGNIIRSTRGTSVFAAYQSNNSDVYLGTTSNNTFKIITNDATAITIGSNKGVQLNGYGSGSFTGTTTYTLAVDSSGNIIETIDGGGDITGSGTANKVAKFTGAKAIGDGPITFATNDSTFAGQIGLGGTGIYTNTASLNIDGLGLAIKNDTAGSNNNWSLIKNTATGSTANLVFISGAGTAVTINHDKTTKFENYASFETSGSAYVRFKHGTGGLNYVGSSESLSSGFGDENDMLNYSVSGKWGVYTNSALALTLDESQNATFAGNVVISGGDGLKINTTVDLQTSAEKFSLNGLGVIRNSSDSAATLYIQNHSTTASTIQPYIFLADSGGNRGGFGVETSTAKVTVNGQGGIRFTTNASGVGGTQALLLDTSQNATFAGDVSIANTNGELNFSSGNGVIQTTTGSTSLTFGVNSTEKMRIHSSGNVGIGTTSPNQDGFGASTKVLSLKANSSGGESVLELIGLGNSDGDQVGVVNFMSQAETTPLAQILGVRHTSDTAGKLYFKTAGSTVLAMLQNQTAYFYNTLYFSSSGVGSISWGSMGGGTGFGIRGESGRGLSLGSNGVWDKMVIDTNGKVGIGTTSPQNQFVIKEGSNVDMEFGSEASGCFIQTYNRTSSAWGYLRFITAGAETMRLDTSGRVGIGTTTPGNYNSNADNLVIYETGDFSGMTLAADNDQGSNIYFADPDDDNVGGITYNHTSNYMNFRVNGAERMRIDSSGNVGIGNTSPQTDFHVGPTQTIGSDFTSGFGSSRFFVVGGDNGGASVFQSGNGAVAMYVYGNTTSGGAIAFYHSNISTNQSGVGSITTTASATAFNTSSDYRLKQDLKDFNGLNLLSKIKVYDFEWKIDNSRSYGVIAHELNEIIPQAVNGEKNAKEMQVVDYSKLVPVLLKSIQELKQEIETLKTQINN